MLFELWDGKRNGLAKNLHSRKSFWNCRTLGFFSCLWDYSSSNIFLMHSFLRTDWPALHLHSVGREKVLPRKQKFCRLRPHHVTQSHRDIYSYTNYFLPLNAEKLPPHIRIPLWEALCRQRATRQLLAQRKYNLRWRQETIYSHRQNIQCNGLISKMDKRFCTTYIFSCHYSQEQF